MWSRRDPRIWLTEKGARPHDWEELWGIDRQVVMDLVSRAEDSVAISFEKFCL